MSSLVQLVRRLPSKFHSLVLVTAELINLTIVQSASISPGHRHSSFQKPHSIWLCTIYTVLGVYARLSVDSNIILIDLVYHLSC